MGATRWPPDLTLRALGQVERFLRDDADMAAPMVLGGVPWVDAAAEATFSNALQAELTWRCPGDHPRCLSLGALDTMRRGLAALYAVTDNLPLPPEWAGRAFDDPQVIRAYTAFCLRAAEIVNSGRLDLSPLITGAYPLSEAVAAFAAAADGKNLRVTLIP